MLEKSTLDVSAISLALALVLAAALPSFAVENKAKRITVLVPFEPLTATAKANPSDIKTVCRLAEALVGSGKLDDARSTAGQAVAAAPTDPKALMCLSDVLEAKAIFTFTGIPCAPRGSWNSPKLCAKTGDTMIY